MAGLFNFFPDFAKNGPGISKDAPPKTGLAMLIDIYRREWWCIIKLNLLFLLFCLPIFTIGPALAAMSKITLTMVQDKNVDLWYDFKNAFRENFSQSLIAGLILAGAGLAVAAASWLYLFYLPPGILVYLLLAINLTVILILLLASFYIFPQIVSVSLPLRTVMRNAVLLGLSCLKHSLPALLFIVAITLIPVLFPSVFPLVLLLYFSNISVFASFAVWPDIKKHIALKAQ